YISRDPIGFLGGMNLYSYPTNPVTWVDPLGLDTSSDAEILGSNLTNIARDPRPDDRYRAHHIVMSNSTDPRMDALRKQMSTLGIDINTHHNGIWLPETVGDRMAGHTMTAHKGEGVHSDAYKQHVFDTLSGAKTKRAFLARLKKLKGELARRKTFACKR